MPVAPVARLLSLFNSLKIKKKEVQPQVQPLGSVALKRLLAPLNPLKSLEKRGN
jgi:hypothetical protein